MNPTAQQPQQATAEAELRVMIGDLLMQIAMLRAENINLKNNTPKTPLSNGLDTNEQQQQAPVQ